MTALFRLSGAAPDDPAVEAWFAGGADGLRLLAKAWFDAVRARGPDVRILLHDGHPAACVQDAAFAYVDAFSAHVNIGFFHGADLPDPHRLLQGSGKAMRHVKLRWGEAVDADALNGLIAAAYQDIRARLRAEGQRPAG